MSKIMILVYIFLGIIFTTLYGAYFSIHPRKYISNINPSNFNLEYENITLKTKDNIELKGWFIPAKSKAAIIILHGYPFDKGNVLPSNVYLNKKYNLLLFDFRAMGESGGKFTSVGYYERLDLLAAIEHLKNRGINNIGVIGFSLGAAVAIMTNSEVKAIVADSSYANIDMMINAMYRPFFFMKYPFVYLTKIYAKLFYKIDTKDISPLKNIKNLKTPVLLIHGEKDSQINVKNSILLHEANPKNELWIIKNADHGASHLVADKEYEERVLQFFDENLQ